MSNENPPKYRKLNTIKSFSEQAYATVQWCEQNGENDEYLKREIEKLKYLSPPNIRRKFNIGESINEQGSWGYAVNSNDSVKFSTKTHESIFLDFANNKGEEWIDWTRTNVVKKSYTVSDEDGNQIPKSKIVLPHNIEDRSVPPEHAYFGTAIDNPGYNSAWYVGFDKSKNFYLRPSWIKNWKNPNIPSVARAQTFKVPSGMGGRLQSVTLTLEYNGGPSEASSPLYVQIWTTYNASAYVTDWDNKKKAVVYKYELANASTPKSYQRYDKIKVYKKYTKGKNKGKYVKNKKGQKIIEKEYYKKSKNGKYVIKRTKIAKPHFAGSGIYKPLAEYTYNPQNTNKGGTQTITFKSPPKIKEGKSYAIVLFSPLNSWNNCPRWAGWGRNCKRDKLYPDGDACISFDNGRSWYRYGQNDKKEVEEYKQGKYTPQDYKFSCKVETKEGKSNFVTVYSTGDHYLYLKPIYSNPIKTVQIAPDGEGTQTYNQDKISAEYQLSVDGENWMDFPENWVLELEQPSKVVFIRVKMSRSEIISGNNDTNESNTPSIESLRIDLQTTLPEEMYIRTVPYAPPVGHIMGASLWGKVFAPYETEPTVECKVDVIEEREAEESFSIIDLDLLDEKMVEKGLDVSWLEGNNNADERCIYLTNHPEILEILKYHRVYIKPHEIEGVIYNLSFAPTSDELKVEAMDTTETIDEDTGAEGEMNLYPENLGGIKITDEVAPPILSCQLEPEGDSPGGVTTYGEWYSYIFDYDNNELIFHREILDKMINGNLTVKYNPVFVKNLTVDEVGEHFDENGIKNDGLVLDYFKETFVIDNTHLEKRRVGLRVQPTDPIKLVYLYKSDADEGEEPLELHEDVDFTVDIYSRELVFEVSNTDGISTILDIGDTLEVVYTPNLTTDAISLGYYAKRTNKDMQCNLKNYYIEYKV